MSPQVYELRVRGPVTDEVLRAIGALDMGEEPPLTILRTEPTDQAGLHGLLERLRSLGLELLEVRRAPALDRPAEDETAGDDAADGGAAAEPPPVVPAPRSGEAVKRRWP